MAKNEIELLHRAIAAENKYNTLVKTVKDRLQAEYNGNAKNIDVMDASDMNTDNYIACKACIIRIFAVLKSAGIDFEED